MHTVKTGVQNFAHESGEVTLKERLKDPDIRNSWVISGRFRLPTD
jgi:hypothetical protein